MRMYVYICKVFYKCYIFVKICLSCAVSSVLGEIKLNSEARKQMAREGGGGELTFLRIAS